jgi:hypothetical protein
MNIRNSPRSRIGAPVAVVAALLHSLMIVRAAQTPPSNPNAFAVSSRTFDLEDFGRPKSMVLSPDESKTIRLARGGSFEVTEGSSLLTSISVKELSSNIEVGWSPDSTQFFISWSSEGAIGVYNARIFRIESGKVIEPSTPQIAYDDFKKEHFCPQKGMNNEYVLGWTPDSKQVFLVLEIYPGTECKQRSLFRGYLLEASTGTIVHVFSEHDTDLIKEASRAAGFASIPVKVKWH